MAYALTGSLGAVSLGANNTGVTPAWGAGSSQTAGDLLLCLVSGINSATLPGTPSGWSVIKSSSSVTATGTILLKIAAGGDAAPTITAATGTKWNVQLGEWSGNANPASDTNGVAAGTTGTNTATLASTDANPGELLVAVASAHYSGTTSMSNSIQLKDGAGNITTHDTERGGTNVEQYGFAWAITANNSAPSSAVYTYTTTNVQHAIVVTASFLVAPVAGGAGTMFTTVRGG